MKFAKRILAVLLSVTLLVTCLTVATYGSSEFTADNIEDIVEYALYGVYVDENFDSLEADTAYQYAVSGDGYSASFNGGAVSPNYKIVSGGAGNNILRLDSKLLSSNNFAVTFTEESNTLVVSFDIRTADLDLSTFTNENNENGSLFEISLTLTKPDGKSATYSFFSVDCHGYNAESPEDSEMSFTYLSPIVNDKGVSTYEEKSLELSPELNSWYHVDAIFNLYDRAYVVDVSDDIGNTESTGSVELAGFESISSLKLRANDLTDDLSKIGTTTWLDNVQVYEGSFVRSLENPEQSVADNLLKLYAMANNPDTDIDDLVRIADAFKAVFVDAAYVIPTDVNNYDHVSEALAEVNSIINETYATAFATYAEEFDSVIGYYNQVDQLELIKRFDEYFSDGGVKLTADEIRTKYELSDELIDGIEEAREIATFAEVLLEKVDYQSTVFVYYVNYEFDPANTDYKYMKAKLEFLSKLVYRDETYIYTPQDLEKPVYKTVGEAEVVYNTLEAKVNAIEERAGAIVAAAPIVCDETKNFDVRYESYVIITERYVGGVVYDGFNNSTYPGLSEALEAFEGCNDMQEKIATCDSFISAVTIASSLTEYAVILAHLDSVAGYMDNNYDEEFVEPLYPGIAEAKALYNSLREKLANDIANANAYIAAVEAVKSKTTYAEKKAAVATALQLKENGDVNGIAGVQAANEALYKAQGEIEALEGYSTTIIATVAELETATDFARRRELIRIGLNCSDKCEDSIEGVTDAKAKLITYKDAFDAEVNALNNAFGSIIKSTASISAGMAKKTKTFDSHPLFEATITQP